jgi:hypothetical protein
VFFVVELPSFSSIFVFTISLHYIFRWKFSDGKIDEYYNWPKWFWNTSLGQGNGTYGDANDLLTDEVIDLSAYCGQTLYINAYDADADPTNEIELPAGGSNGQVLQTDGSGNYTWVNQTVDKDTDTQLNEASVDAMVANNGFITNADDADADPTNEIQDISISGTDLTISGGSTLDLSFVDTDTQLDSTDIANMGFVNEHCNLAIGDTYARGTIFYLDPSGCHGLVVKETDEAGGAYNWSLTDFETWSFAEGLYGGQQNTTKSIHNAANNFSACPAADACASLVHAGFDDWYLPSKGELNLMFVNLHLQGLGNFSSYYWSSTEINASEAFMMHFNPGGPQYPGLKSLNVANVRVIRAF